MVEIFRGARRKRFLNGGHREKRLAPVLVFNTGTDGRGSGLCIGYTPSPQGVQDKPIIFPLKQPRLIEGWRCVQILDRLDEVHPEAIGASWYVSRDEEAPCGIVHLANIFGGRKKLRKLEDECRGLLPTADVLERMLACTRACGASIDTREVRKTQRILAKSS
jgi:hypothetical protein